MESQQRPIGYWVKELDRRIEDTFTAALAEHQLTRRHWQALTVLRQRPADLDAVTEALAPFWDGTGPAARQVLDDLVRRDWIFDDGGSFTLSEAGRQGYEVAAARVTRVRSAVSRGVTDEQYQATVATLRTMVENLRPS
jgi:hypothetical protein